MQSKLTRAGYAHQQNATLRGCALRHMGGISFSIEIDWTKKVNSMATVASIVDNCALLYQMCVCV